VHETAEIDAGHSKNIGRIVKDKDENAPQQQNPQTIRRINKRGNPFDR